ncbi:DUF6114 domain-containing protein [Micromonospora echinospora]|uniref:DUF6114 domain-containing protein n=1 Tax=Micromonospora echinospora TaxID=1877 RepID=UPI003A89535A
MTSADPQHARSGGFSQTRRRFHRWRRSRPFWGGLLTALAGVQIFGTTQMSLGGLTFQMGPTGFLSWVIPTILVACGMFMWFTPQHRMFYAVVAAVTALFSLIGVNLGGFFVGLLLGMVGSALGFAWAPARATASATGEAVAVGEPPAVAQSTAVPPATAVPAAGAVPSAGAAPAGPGPATVPEADDPDRTLVDEIMPVDREAGPSPRDPRFLAGAVALLALGAAGLLALNGPMPVRAAPLGSGCHTPTAPAPSGPPTTPGPSTAPDPGDDTPTPDPGTARPTTPPDRSPPSRRTADRSPTSSGGTGTSVPGTTPGKSRTRPRSGPRRRPPRADRPQRVPPRPRRPPPRRSARPPPPASRPSLTSPSSPSRSGPASRCPGSTPIRERPPWARRRSSPARRW